MHGIFGIRMKKSHASHQSWFRILLTLFILSLSLPVFAQGYRGHDFWVCFPQNRVQDGRKVLQQSIYITSESRAKGQIENWVDGSKQPFSIEAGASASFEVDTLTEITSNGETENKSLHITSDNDITVYVVSHHFPSTDSYAAIPTSMLGLQYVVADYGASAASNVGFTSQAEIIATEDTTLVTTHLSSTLRDSLPAGRTISFFMNRGQTLQLQGREQSDLTGTTVTSTKPIAFLTGHNCTQNSRDSSYCGMLLEMEPPARDWGTSFIVGKFAGKDYSIVRIIANSDSTRVWLNGAPIAQLMRGGYCEVDTLHGDAVISTSKPALVAQYATNALSDRVRIGGPFLIFITPNDRFISEVTATPVIEGVFMDYLNVVVPDSGIASLELDGVVFGKYPATADLESKRKVPHSPYSILTFRTPPGRHLVRCAVPVAVYSYGFGLYNNTGDSYGHSCGERLEVK